jgi:hypothetical protein
MARRILVLLLDDQSREELQEAVVDEGDGRPQVRVVAPIQIGPLEWLATDEDAARAEAAARALATEWTLAEAAQVEGGEGEFDPELAVEDALRTFPADEIFLVGGDRQLARSLRRFRLPVRRLGGERQRANGRLRQLALEFAVGRSRATPFLAFAAANLALLVLAALITLVVLLVLFLWLL